MNTKLTLKLESEVIDNAKYYAKEHHTSLSKLVERFLDNLTREKKIKLTSPIVQELSGILVNHKLPNEHDRFEYLMKKYS